MKRKITLENKSLSSQNAHYTRVLRLQTVNLYIKERITECYLRPISIEPK